MIDKELEKILIDNEFWSPNMNQSSVIPPIKSTILEAIEKEEQTNPYLTPKARVCYDRGVADCLEVCNKLLGDSNDS